MRSRRGSATTNAATSSCSAIRAAGCRRRPQPPRHPVIEAGDWLLSLVGLSAPDSDDHLIKRIIGLPGDHVVCCNPIGQITVNGVPDRRVRLPQALAGIERGIGRLDFDIVVPDDSLWVLGDNRDRSKDSRYNQEEPGKGFVPVENVVGRAFLITWPLNRFGGIDTHHEVFAGVPEPTPAMTAHHDPRRAHGSPSSGVCCASGRS